MLSESMFRVRKPCDRICRGRQAEVALEVLQELLVGVVADRQDPAEAERKIVGDVIQPELPAGLGLDDVGAERAVRHRAEAVEGIRDLSEGDADGGVAVAHDVALEEAG
jgi:hypothetical protein